MRGRPRSHSVRCPVLLTVWEPPPARHPAQPELGKHLMEVKVLRFPQLSISGTHFQRQLF